MTIFLLQQHDMMTHIKIVIFLFSPSYDHPNHPISIVDIKLMAGPLCIAHLVDKRMDDAYTQIACFWCVMDTKSSYYTW